MTFAPSTAVVLYYREKCALIIVGRRLTAYITACRCMEYYCQGVVISDNSCKVYAAPLYPTKSYLTCLKLDMIEDHYTYELREDEDHAAACRQTYTLTTCTNVSLTSRDGNLMISGNSQHLVFIFSMCVA